MSYARFIVTICTLLLIAFRVQSATINVPGDQSTIQSAIDVSATGDSILVYPGTYSEILSFAGKSVSVVGVYGPDSTYLTYPVRCDSFISFSNGEDTLTVIRGFTVENVLHNYGVVRVAHSSARISECVFRNNANTKPSPTSWGVIAGLQCGYLIVEKCLFEGNQSYSSAGVGVACGEGRVTECVFLDNEAFGDYSGAIGIGGIFCQSAFDIRDNVFVNNTAPHGGAVFISENTGTIIQNNTFHGNSSADGGSVCVWYYCEDINIENNVFSNSIGYAITSYSDPATSINCNVAYNSIPEHYEPGIVIDSLSVVADPLFCDTSVRNLTLQDQSPCLPANNACQQLVGALNAGCSYCCTGHTGNVNADSQDFVDISDLTTLVNYLFVTFAPLQCPAEANTNGDTGCNIDISDLTRLVNYLFDNFVPLSACDLHCE